ncbi:hypothetical protein [Parasphingorhabdus halotolerans]|uniref:Uncharacterized protein n=1 Tax=Parasphingorhabdus halotolerans TaxID=2725558 RepID=A0A6H2DKB5_9SPHN|nr:hypothetical protein [Parasphingorhabdus halotolerans]QJB69109.1 hypothetical protein HF685_07275 [Parasphingorhabdus halotolerans]
MKIFFLAIASTALLVAPALAKDKDAVKATEVAKKAEKPKKITDRSHPDYIRCRSEPIIGSLSRKNRVCMTNREWVAYTQKGSAESREMLEGLQSGANSSN